MVAAGTPKSPDLTPACFDPVQRSPISGDGLKMWVMWVVVPFTSTEGSIDAESMDAGPSLWLA